LYDHIICKIEERACRERVETGFFWNFTPAAITMSGNISNEFLIFLR
jgi:hypothetical protein